MNSLRRVTITVGSETQYSGFAQVSEYDVLNFDPVPPSTLTALLRQILGELGTAQFFPRGGSDKTRDVTINCVLDGIAYVVNFKECPFHITDIVTYDHSDGNRSAVPYSKECGPKVSHLGNDINVKSPVYPERDQPMVARTYLSDKFTKS